MGEFLEAAEIEMQHMAIILKLIIEGAAVFIIAFSVFKTISRFIRTYRKRDSEEFYHEMRLDLGLSLALSLEFLLAADIVATAITPTWETIGLLAAIAGIRTFLNYFLQKEVKELEIEEPKYKRDRMFTD